MQTARKKDRQYKHAIINLMAALTIPSPTPPLLLSNTAAFRRKISIPQQPSVIANYKSII
jgi:hypothetical protein